MLKRESIEKIFSVARSKNLSCAELYLEKSTSESTFFQGKQYKTLKSNACGASLLCRSPEGPVHFNVSQIAPEAVLEILGEEPIKLSPLATDKITYKKPASNLDRLLPFARKIENLTQHFSIQYTENSREFAIINEEGKITLSQDENVEFNYKTQKEASCFQVAEYQNSIETFWQDSFQENDFLKKIKERLEVPSLWPLPKGEVPILLSNYSLAQLLNQVLKGCQADSLVSKSSFLTYLEESIGFLFSLEEYCADSQVDQEGQPTKQISLYTSGEFKEIATDKKLASALSLPKSGHGRRMNYKHPPTISLFSTHLVPNENIWLNFANLKKAIFIEGIEILSYDPKTTRAKLSVTHSKLIHHGDFGEKLVQWEWELSLLETLKCLKQFSKDSKIHGFKNTKKGSELFSQISCPDALIEGIPLPGTVPQEYYWEA